MSVDLDSQPPIGGCSVLAQGRYVFVCLDSVRGDAVPPGSENGHVFKGLEVLMYNAQAIAIQEVA